MSFSYLARRLIKSYSCNGHDRGHLNKFRAQACNDVRRGGGMVPVLLTVGELERHVG
ncbi:MAG: hypothetical protein MIO93_02310 [ANME-2 cluster archaeon]|nr:hypothetical protein [ANME-2 cluster archaeon]